MLLKNSKIFYVVNADWYFLAHRLAMARASREAGARVFVVSADTGQSDKIREAGLEFIRFPISRKSVNPFRELTTLRFLVRLYRKHRPDLVHHYTIKPVIYGTIASRMAGGIPIVNTISGLGYTFSSNNKSPWLRHLVGILCRIAFKHPRFVTIFENPDDRLELIRMGLLREENTVLIPGAGVDCTTFTPAPEPEGDPVVMLASRMLWDKGIGEFVEAAGMLRKKFGNVRFVLVGKPDPGNPTSVPLEQLQRWNVDGDVEWWGYRNDMPEVLSMAHIVVLPSFYREGIPRTLLEAAASGRPLVATDVPGCREIVREGVNGFLVPPRDSYSLASAIESLLVSPDLRAKFGEAGRRIAVEEYAEEIVIERMFQIYSSILEKRRAPADRRHGA